jgi:hypothetical protein
LKRDYLSWYSVRGTLRWFASECISLTALWTLGGRPCFGFDSRHVIRVAVIYGKGMNAGNVVGVVFLDPVNDAGNQRCASVKGDPDLAVVLDRTLPAVDGTDGVDLLSAGAPAFLDEVAGEGGEPLRVSALMTTSEIAAGIVPAVLSLSAEP